VWLYFAYAPSILSSAPSMLGRTDAVVEEVARLDNLGSFFAALFQGNLGYSFRSSQPVWSILVGSLGTTVLLIIISIAISAATGAFVALVASRFSPKGRMPLVSVYSLRGYFFALTIWTGVILFLFFSYYLGWFPSAHSQPDYWLIHPPENILIEIEGRLRHLALPMLTLTIVFMIRSFFVVWSGGARFTSEKTLRNLFLPLTTVDFACIISAVVLIENVFLLPGVGWQLFMSVEYSDLNMMLGAFLVLLAIAMILGFVAVLFDLIQRRYSLFEESEKKVHTKTENEERHTQNVPNMRLGHLLRLLLGKKSLILGLVIVCSFVIVGLVAPLLTPYDPTQFGVAERFAQPAWYKSLSWGDEDRVAFGLLGTDEYGRDIFSQVVYGARNMLLVAVPMAVVAALIGLALGFAASRFGNLIDNIIRLFVDTTLALPIVPLLVVVSWALWSSPVDWALLWVLSALVAMASRRAYLARTGERVLAGRALRSGFPSLFMDLSANFCFVMVSLILLNLIGSFGFYQPLSGLDFYAPTWSGMLGSALSTVYLFDAWWLWVPPLSCIMLFAAGFLLIGLGLEKRL
jgi:peptide/nickel transport system permease protein